MLLRVLVLFLGLALFYGTAHSAVIKKVRAVEQWEVSVAQDATCHDCGYNYPSALSAPWPDKAKAFGPRFTSMQEAISWGHSNHPLGGGWSDYWVKYRGYLVGYNTEHKESCAPASLGMLTIFSGSGQYDAYQELVTSCVQDLYHIFNGTDGSEYLGTSNVTRRMSFFCGRRYCATRKTGTTHPHPLRMGLL